MIFESHAHYDDEAYNEDRYTLLDSMPENNIGCIINVSASLQTIKSTMDLVNRYDYVYGAVGVHPSETEELDDNSMEWIRQQAEHKKCVAIGEIGLDYHYPDPEPDIQKKWFERQLFLAKEMNKPVIIHSREAAKDTMDILHGEAGQNIRGVMHCYSYSAEIAKELLKMDYYFGIGGVVTFSNAKKLVEALDYIPVEKILLETDCPYLAPTPHRGERNSSLYIPLIVEKIAQIKNISCEEVENITQKNAERLFFNKD